MTTYYRDIHNVRLVVEISEDCKSARLSAHQSLGGQRGGKELFKFDLNEFEMKTLGYWFRELHSRMTPKQP
jgi:hypothetical protein